MPVQKSAKLMKPAAKPIVKKAIKPVSLPAKAPLKVVRPVAKPVMKVNSVSVTKSPANSEKAIAVKEDTKKPGKPMADDGILKKKPGRPAKTAIAAAEVLPQAGAKRGR